MTLEPCGFCLTSQLSLYHRPLHWGPWGTLCFPLSLLPLLTWKEEEGWVASVVSDSVQSHRGQPIRLPHPWDSQGKNSGVGCHFLLQCMKVKSKVKSLSRVRLLATLWTVAHQAPPSMGFSRQEYWSGVPLPSLVNDASTQLILNLWIMSNWAPKPHFNSQHALYWRAFCPNMSPPLPPHQKKKKKGNSYTVPTPTWMLIYSHWLIY